MIEPLGSAASPAAAPRSIDLTPVFRPRSIAVVGASARSWIAETVRDNLRLMASDTRCHFVNPKYEELLGQPCYPSLDALPERPDIALVALNPLRAAMVTQAAADAGIPAVIIPGGGVVEGGEAAAAMQAEVADIARRHGMALVGPNCMGVIDLTANAATYIGDVSPYLPRGGVAGIAQSGSVTDAFVQSGSRIGFSRIISCGSEVVLDVCDYLAYCLDDPETTSVILFLEGFRRPERFLALADRALELGKPIMAVKVGRSEQARAAAIAHSGSLAGEDRATDAAFDAAGVIRCADLDELLETAELVEGTRRTGRGIGRGRTGVVTVSTGEASLIADLAPSAGLDLPPLPDAARTRILETLPTMGFLANPLDPWGAADPALAYGAVFEAMATSDAYDVLVLVHDFPYRSMPAEVETANEVTAALLDATRERPWLLPVYVSLTSGEHPPETKALLDEAGHGAPLLRGASESFRAIGSLARWERRRAGSRRRRTMAAVVAGPRRRPDGLRPRRDPARAATRSQRAARAREPRRPARGRARRDAGRRRTRCGRRGRGGSAARWPCGRAQDRCPRPRPQDRPRARAGRVARRRRDPIGRRGAVPDGSPSRGRCARPARRADGRRRSRADRGHPARPVVRADWSWSGWAGCSPRSSTTCRSGWPRSDRAAALSMLDDLRGARLLDGARGRSPVDREAVADLIVGLASFASARPDIVEVDLNPVIAASDGAVAVDALVVIAGPAAEPPLDQPRSGHA